MEKAWSLPGRDGAQVLQHYLSGFSGGFSASRRLEQSLAVVWQMQAGYLILQLPSRPVDIVSEPPSPPPLFLVSSSSALSDSERRWKEATGTTQQCSASCKRRTRLIVLWLCLHTTGIFGIWEEWEILAARWITLFWSKRACWRKKTSGFLNKKK